MCRSSKTRDYEKFAELAENIIISIRITHS